MIQRRHWFSQFIASAALLCAPLAFAADEAPDVLVKRVTGEVIETVKTDAAIQGGDINRIVALVDSKIMPNVNFTRMTASAVGRHWRDATPEQQKRLQEEFKTLLVRTYSGALAEVKASTTVNFKPLRMGAADTDTVVRTEIKGAGQPVQLDYRMEKAADGWKIYDLNVLGVWLVDTYRAQFAQEITAKGLDGLIATLAGRNKSASKG